MKYCPMKFISMNMNNKYIQEILREFSEKDVLEVVLGCNKEFCAWYCTYTNGEGECATHSLPGLFDGLDSIATQIATK